MTAQIRIAAGLAMLGLVGGLQAHAATVTGEVNGRSGPWDIAANPGYSYGEYANGEADAHFAPASFSAASGLAFVAGDALKIEYVSGSPLAGAGGTVWGSGGDGVAWWGAYDANCTGAPGCYTGQVTYLEQLIGTYANAQGQIVGTPFVVGSGPTTKTIPVGATQLLLGFNDGWYNDNGSSITVKVSDVSAVPEPGAVALLMAGMAVVGGIKRGRSTRA